MKLHLAMAKAVGSIAVVEEKEAELLLELTAPTEQCAGQRRPQDSTTQEPPPYKKCRKGVYSYL